MTAIVLQQITKTLIGRFCPGFYLLLMGCWCTNAWPALPVLPAQEQGAIMPLMVLIFLGYGLGCVLDSMGHSIFDREFLTWGARVALPVSTSPRYQYDLIRLTDLAAGFRLVRLASERDACRSIILGTPLLVLLMLSAQNLNANYLNGVHILNRRGEFLWMTIALTFFASVLHLRHLKIRFAETLLHFSATTKNPADEKSPSIDG